ncbi:MULTISPECIES: general stress protein [unclassified Diaminobutyricimonas]|uniref:general stress protein n=1 Tax=unclassified Diaminobutyricimonas TaxID=2643261 RepID=UPI0012F49CC4|nr:MULTISPECIES: general stress protein [unclassified Diaminobutyricimonas]
MTNQSPFSRRTPALPSVPRGDVLGTYETYVEAQKVVDVLAKADFDVKKLSIIGNDLKTVERVTGKLSYGRAALAGAASGAWFGLFLGLLLFIFSPTPNLAVVASAALIGAGFGMLFSLATYGLNRRKRDFTSMTQVLATNYQIVIDPNLTAQAQSVLGQPSE